MKRIALGIALGLCVTAIVAVTKVDNRYMGDQYPIAKYSTTQLSFAVGDANAASTTLYNINGMLERIDVITSDANTTGDNFSVSIADEGGTELVAFSTISMDSAARTLYLSTSDETDFNSVPVNGNLVITVDPNGEPNDAALTVDINVFLQ
jgi:hypothetical protein